jgi:hypothetical protein
MFVQLLSDGGLGVGLIRRPEAPQIEDLRVLLGYQIVLTVTLAAAIAATRRCGPSVAVPSTMGIPASLVGLQ